MLLPDNVHPELCIFYNGGLVIRELLESNSQSIFKLYTNVKANTEMSFGTFLLCLDWLYLINVAVINERGEVQICSSID